VRSNIVDTEGKIKVTTVELRKPATIVMAMTITDMVKEQEGVLQEIKEQNQFIDNLRESLNTSEKEVFKLQDEIDELKDKNESADPQDDFTCPVEWKEYYGDDGNKVLCPFTLDKSINWWELKGKKGTFTFREETESAQV